MNWPYKIWCGFIAAIVIVPRHQSSTCAAPRALQSDDSECQRHVDCGFLGNDPGSPQFCSDELFCEPCRGGWWDTNGGACHGEMSVDGNCASCGVGTPPAAFGDPMEAAEATMATEPEDAECFDHANCNVPGFAQFCSDEFFCEPCREGWWDTNGGECHGGMSVDGSCAPCGGRPGAEGRPPTPRPSAPVPSCEDGNESCEAWATAGECEVNPTFMLTNCARSCNTCESAAPAPRPIPAPSLSTTNEREGTSIPVTNPSFENGARGWSLSAGGIGQRSDSLAAPPEGTGYLALSASTGAKQTLPVTIEAGKTYSVKVWARSTNPSIQSTTTPSTIAKLSLMAVDSNEIRVGPAESISASVEPPTLTERRGGNTKGDDGVNVWIENGYRMHAAEEFYSQKIDEDPIMDPWRKGREAGDGMAKGPIIVRDGPRALYGTFYTEGRGGTISRIDKRDLLGSAPNYALARSTGEDTAGETFETILSHRGDQFPWVIDAHLTHDKETGRLWMAWGGHALWVTELDARTGNVMGNPSSPEFDTHPPGTHTCVAAWEPNDYRVCSGADRPPTSWEGDENGVAYIEGPSLYKKDSNWYLCGSYGSMGFSYTIRCCRSDNPTGLFVDKDGIGCTNFDSAANRFGASMLFGPEGHQAVPGHPHMWREEDGSEFIGYDFRKYQRGRSEENPITSPDEMGIRRLYWVDGWPTIWTPMEITYRADDHPDAIGERLQIELENTGAPSSMAAFDLVSARVSSPPQRERKMSGSSATARSSGTAKTWMSLLSCYIFTLLLGMS